MVLPAYDIDVTSVSDPSDDTRYYVAALIMGVLVAVAYLLLKR